VILTFNKDAVIRNVQVTLIVVETQAATGQACYARKAPPSEEAVVSGIEASRNTLSISILDALSQVGKHNYVTVLTLLPINEGSWGVLCLARYVVWSTTRWAFLQFLGTPHCR
jgi:hypothetical protein